jgi:hypothetical protein
MEESMELLQVVRKSESRTLAPLRYQLFDPVLDVLDAETPFRRHDEH